MVIGEPSGTPREKEPTEAVNEPAADQQDHARDKAPVIYDVVSHLKKVPARLSIYDALCLSKKYREMLLNALLDQKAREVMMTEIESEMEEMKITGTEDRPVEQVMQIDRSSMITFSEEDRTISLTDHNRPLMVTGLIRDIEVRRCMLDDGSAVNIMSLKTLQQLGFRQTALRPSAMVIQGFNQDGQRVLGSITVMLEIEELSTKVTCQVIDAMTTYNILLGRPWLHQYGIIPSTYHQCFKYNRDGVQYRVAADPKPYSVTESFLADAQYYRESDGAEIARKANKPTEVAQGAEPQGENPRQVNEAPRVVAEATRAHGGNPLQRKKFYLIPKHLRKEGQSVLKQMTSQQMSMLQSSFNMPVPKVERIHPFPKAPSQFCVPPTMEPGMR